MKPPTIPRSVGFASRRTRSRFIRGLKEKGIRDPDVLSALECVPRHRFVDEALASRAYDDIPLPIGYQQTISQPFIVALMSEKLITGTTDRSMVLEIGTGCGYQTAILAHLYDRVCSIERIQPLFERATNTLATLQIDNVELQHGDGYEGWKSWDRLKFNSILLTAAPNHIPLAILRQLAIGGRLIAPVGESINQRLKIVNNRRGRFYEEDAEEVRFVPLVPGVKV
jgi:protein-L-isoaspartate(D-aspartate) O-methyltransferase